MLRPVTLSQRRLGQSAAANVAKTPPRLPASPVRKRRRVLAAGDRLLVVGPEESAPRLREWVGDDRPEHEEHGWTEPELEAD